MILPRNGAGGRIADRGYQHYDGMRHAPSHALWTMARGAMARGLGIRRPFRSKIVPWLLLIAANIPVIVLLAFQILSRNAGASIPSYVELETSSLPLVFLLFAGVVGPDLFCTDRRERVLSLYFASPVTRFQYLVARVGSLTVLLLGLTLAPLLFLFIGNALLTPSAADYVRDHLHDLAHIFLAGLLLAVYYGSLSSAVSSFSDRRTYAGGAFIGLLLVSAAPTNLIAYFLDFTGHDKFVLLDLFDLGPRTVRWLFGTTPLADTREVAAQAALRIDGWAYLLVLLGVIVVSLLVLFRRYRRLEA